MRRLLGRSSVAILWILMRGTPTYADDKQESAAYPATITEGLRAYNAGDFAEARALFLRAHRLQPSARTLRGVGMTEYALKHYAEAMRWLSQAQSDPRNPLTASQREEASKLLTEMNVFVGRYELVREPEDLHLTVDGAAVSPDDKQLMLDIGEHKLVAHASGYRSEERKLDVKGGEDEPLRFALIALDSPRMAASKPAPTIEAPRTARPIATASQGDQRAEAPLLGRRETWGWLSLGTGAAALVGSVVAWRVYESAADRWNDNTVCLRDMKSREANCGGDLQTAEAARTWAVAGLVATGVLTATATFLLWPRNLERERKSQASAHCDVDPFGLSVACAARF